MRAHIVAALYVVWFSGFFSLSRAEYAILFLTFGLVLCAEVVNTSIERLCDRDTEGFSQWARVVKDTAAGAVLVCALFAVGVGICLFWNPDTFRAIWEYFLCVWWRLPLLGLSVVVSVGFIQWGPAPLLERLHLIRHK